MLALRFPRLLLALLFLFIFSLPGGAQTPAHTDRGVHSYAAHGTAEQPFTIQVIVVRRTVEHVLLVKLALTNNGTGPLQPGKEFAGDTDLADNHKISAVYAEDPGGRKKFPVVRDAGNVALCSTINPPVRPGERRMLYAQLSAPPDTCSAFDLYFPQADPITNIPLDLGKTGRTSLVDSSSTAVGLATPGRAVSLAPGNNVTAPTNNEPNVSTNQTIPAVSATPLNPRSR